VCVTLRSAALLFAFDPKIGYFQSGALTVLLYVLQVLTAACCIALPFLINNYAWREPAAPSLTATVGSLLTALALAAVAIVAALRGNTFSAPAFISILAVAFCALGTLCFLLPLLRVKPRVAVLFYYAAIIAFILLLAVTYFDRYVQMNAPHKISLHLAFLAAALALVARARILIGCEKPALTVVSHLLAFSLCAACGIPNLIAFLAGSYTDAFYLTLDLLTLAAAVYFGAHTCAALRPAPDKEVA
jgi:hypothetical protein